MSVRVMNVSFAALYSSVLAGERWLQCSHSDVFVAGGYVPRNATQVLEGQSDEEHYSFGRVSEQMRTLCNHASGGL